MAFLSLFLDSTYPSIDKVILFSFMVSFGNLTFWSSWNLCCKVRLKINFLETVYFFKTDLNNIPAVHSFGMLPYRPSVLTCPSATYCPHHLPRFADPVRHHRTVIAWHYIVCLLVIYVIVSLLHFATSSGTQRPLSGSRDISRSTTS